MNYKKLLTILLALGLIAGLGFVAIAKDKKNKLEDKAKITKAEAEKTALEKAPDGKIESADLEEEDGKLIWSVDISRPGTKNITEVAVDAITGKVISTEIETPGQQAKEKAEHAAKEKK